MATLKKISDINLDINKTAVVCGKGPTLSNLDNYLKDKNLDDFYFFGINTAFRLMKRCDFLAVSDLHKLRDVEKNNFEVYNNIKNFIIPLVFRDDLMPHIPNGYVVDTNVTYKWFLDKLQTYKNINIFTYKLFTQTLKVDVNCDIQDTFLVERAFSNMQVLIEWIVRAGIKKFEIFGMEKTNKYNANFVVNKEDNPLLDPSVYVKNFDLTVNILEKHGCAYNIH